MRTLLLALFASVCLLGQTTEKAIADHLRDYRDGTQKQLDAVNAIINLLDPPVPVTYTVSGTVTASGAPLAGVTVSLSGPSTASVVTDAAGAYSFPSLAAGDYTVTPSLEGYTFDPASSSITSLAADQTLNFVATAVPPVTHFEDNFDRANGSPGSNWDIVNGSWMISGNKLIQTNPNAGRTSIEWLALWSTPVPSSIADSFYVRVKITKPTATNRTVAIPFKYLEDAGTVTAYVAILTNLSSATDTWGIYRYNGTLTSGTYTLLGTTTAEEFTDGSIAQIEYDHGTLRFGLWDGTTFTSKVTTTDNAFEGRTGYVGLRTNDGPGISFDDFEFGLLEPPPAGATFHPANSTEFAQALIDAHPGDTIELTVGVTYKGNFTITSNNGDNPVTIRSAGFSMPDGKRVLAKVCLDSAGQMVRDPNDYMLTQQECVNNGHQWFDDTPNMAIITNNSNQPAITFENGSGGWRISGVYFTSNPALYTYNLILGHQPSDESQLPANITLDHNVISGVGEPSCGTGRAGVFLAANNLVLRDNYINNWKSCNQDANAFSAVSGGSGYQIINNYLEAAGENIIFGGDGGNTPHPPRDITIERNYFYKPLYWKGVGLYVKNLLELKDAQHVTVRHNILQNSWPASQTGMAFNFTPRGEFRCFDANNAIVKETIPGVGTVGVGYNRCIQGGVPGYVEPFEWRAKQPWFRVDDVLVEQNSIKNAEHFLLIAGTDDGDPEQLPKMDGVTFRNNMAVLNRHVFVIKQGPKNLVIDRNTIYNKYNLADCAGSELASSYSTGFRFTNNIASQAGYGVRGDGTNTGTPTLNRYFAPGWTWENNVLYLDPELGTQVYQAQNAYPTGTHLPNLADVGFVDFGAKNLALQPTSPYLSAGADVATILEQTTGVESGVTPAAN